MNYKKGQRVRVQNSIGNLVIGEIKDTCDLPTIPAEGLSYWCEYMNTFDGVNYHSDVNIFFETSLDLWNKRGSGICNCGGDAVGATKHPIYCGKYQEEL